MVMVGVGNGSVQVNSQTKLVGLVGRWTENQFSSQICTTCIFLSRYRTAYLNRIFIM